MGLRSRAMLTAACVFALCGAMLVATVNVIAKRQMANATESASLRAAALVKQEIRSRAERLSLTVEILADRPGTKDLYQINSPATVNDHLRGLCESFHLDGMYMADSDGVVLGTAGLPRLAAGDKAPYDLPRAGSTQGWSDSRFRSNELFIVAVQPIASGGFVHGYLVGIQKVDDRVALNLSRSLGFALLIGDGVHWMASSLPNEVATEGKHLTTQLRGDRLEGLVIGLPRNGAGQQPFVGALVSEREFTSPLHALERGAGWSFLVAGGFSLLILVSASGKLLNAVEGLTLSAAEVGSGRWPRAASEYRRDEVGVLQRVFDDMAKSLRQNESRLLEMLQIDPLTGLMNQRSFREALDRVREECLSGSKECALAHLDIDHFSEVNEKVGTEKADEFLKQVAAAVLEICGGHPAARLQPDHFLFVAPSDGAERLSEDLLKRLRELGLTASIGVVPNIGFGQPSDVLLLSAKIASEQAKLGGRNRVRIYESKDAFTNQIGLRQFLQQSSYAAIRALAEAVDAKDEYTRGHSRRVAEYARSIASAAGLDSGFQDLIYVSGELHDVGKIGVPDSVLKKEGKLTDEEFAVVKRHPELGEKIVAQIPQLVDALPGVRSHHERWDGKGYPDGLKGEQIPLQARILAYADTYDAMTSDRPYRKGMPDDRALQIIRSESGLQFDPNLLQAFITWHSEHAAGRKAA